MEMDHREAKELLGSAAVEPHGLERLAAGDTPDSVALAGHLAGCATCAADFDRLRAQVAVLRSTVRSLPSDDLKARTLAYVASMGRPRVAAPAGATTLGATLPGAARATPASWRPSSSRWLPWLASAAAILIAAGGLVAWRSAADQLADARSQTATLSRLTAATIAVAAAPDARTVALRGGSGQSGTLLYSWGASRLVVVAQGLPAPGPGQVYRCWIETAGPRQAIGEMWQAGDVQYWDGWSQALGSIGAGTRFGVSLAPADGGAGGEPVLTGIL